MTNEKVISILNDLKVYYNDKNEDSYVGFDDEDNEAIDMAIKALEQKPCDDCISREEAKQFLYERIDRLNDDELYDIFSRIIDDMYNELQPVTPKYTDEEIQKMQELEQAQLEKAYELGKAESFEEWLSSFNTESAPQCFNAVQQLKEKLNGQMD